MHARLPCHKVYRGKLDRLLIKVKVESGRRCLLSLHKVWNANNTSMGANRTDNLSLAVNTSNRLSVGSVMV